MPKWVQDAVEFPGEIEQRSGERLEHLEGLDHRLRRALAAQISVLFPVQKAALPELMAFSIKTPLLPPRDVAISAPTGSGKTLCYVLPVLNFFSAEPAPAGVLRSLVLVPTRNLVAQIEKVRVFFSSLSFPRISKR